MYKPLLALTLGLLASCGDMQYPELVDAARQQCASRGGLAYHKFYSEAVSNRSRKVVVRCADGVKLEFNVDYERRNE